MLFQSYTLAQPSGNFSLHELPNNYTKFQWLSFWMGVDMNGNDA